jgi:hypothetical protein
MPHTYIEDVKNIIGTLCTDDGLILEEKLILLGLLTDHIREVTKQLEDELSADARGLVY